MNVITSYYKILLLISTTYSMGEKDLMSYYYPTGESNYTQVYYYINQVNRDLDEYWIVSYDAESKTMTTKNYDANFVLYNQFVEVVHDDRAELVRYSDFDENHNETKSKILKTEVYQSGENAVYSYAVEYTNTWGRFNFEKKRRFDQYETINFSGKQYQVAKFQDLYIINAIDLKEEYQYGQSTYYAEGIGMVKYERLLPTMERRTLELAGILSQEDFDKLVSLKR